MADGLGWGQLQTELKGPGVEIRRQSAAGLSVCLIRVQAGGHTDTQFAGLPDDRCQCAHWGYIIAGTIRVHTGDGAREYAQGETYHWDPGHNLEAVTDVEYLEISDSDCYDALMRHCRARIGATNPS